MASPSPAGSAAASASPSPAPSPSFSSDPSASLEAFLDEQKTLERIDTINRIVTKAFKLNPFDVLDIAFNASSDEIMKHYRKMALLVHPDKVDPEHREQAAQAQSLLTQAKEELLNEEKRSLLDRIIADARAKLDADRDKEQKEFAKDFKQKNPGKEPPPKPFPMTYDEAWKVAVREALIDAEWRKRQLLKMAAQEQGKADAEAEAKKRVRDEKEQHEKDWEETRDKRVQSWRDFSKAAVKKRKLAPKKSKDAVQRDVHAARTWEDEKELKKVDKESHKWA